MFRDRVVAHYVHRGYTVEADRIVTGESGSPHRPDLICAGDLGDLVVYFGDEEPMMGPELGAIRRAANDLGAGPVVAVPDATSALKEAAREHRIVLLEAADLGEPAAGLDLDSIDLVEMPKGRAAAVVGDLVLEAPEPIPEPAQLAPASVPVVEAPAARVGAFDWLPERSEAEATTVERNNDLARRVGGALMIAAVTLGLVVAAALLFF